MYCTRKHDRRHGAVGLRHREIAIEIAGRATVDLDSFARHVMFSWV
jgi:hypothetical protein